MDLDASRLDLDVDVEIKSPHHGPVTWLDIDSAEERYLLTGLTVITAATGLALSSCNWSTLRACVEKVL